MAHGDLQLRAYSQIAYMELEVRFQDYCKANGVEKVALSDLLSDKEIQKMNKLGITDAELATWKLVGVHDTNDENGFYACMIETGPGKVVVSYRGSEAFDDIGDMTNDWVGADLGLVNSTCTNQQKEVDRFLAKYRTTLGEYDSVTMTGHSLGGNLAEYATIVSGKYGLDDNITQCVSLDGPGFSDEFIAQYEEEIKKMSPVMRHPRWSLVGTMLNDLPGVDYEFVQVSNENNDIFGIGDYNDFTRHDTRYLVFDEGGNLVIGEENGLSKITSVISEGVDHAPPIVGNITITVVGTLLIGAVWLKDKMFDEKGNLTADGYAIIASLVGIAVILGPKVTLALVVTVLALAVVVLVVFFVAELIYDLVNTIVNVICETLENVYNWAKEKVAEIKKAVIDTIKKAQKWYNENFNDGYKYAEQNTLIQVNTSTLRSYADRLASVQKRIKKLDRRLDDLYTKVGLDDIGKLVKADALTGHNWKITGCINYLNDTASDFEKIEKKIAAQF